MKKRKSRIAAINKERRRLFSYDQNALSPPMRKIVKTWNEHSYLKNKPSLDNRNNPYVNKQRYLLIPVLKEAIKKIKLPFILFHINNYLDACKEDKHIIKGQNRGYSCLHTFIKKIIKIETGTDEIWWQYESLVSNKKKGFRDSNRWLTKEIVKIYGDKILEAKGYKIDRGTPAHDNFVLTSKRITDFIKLNPQFKTTEMVLLIIEALEEYKEINVGYEIYPGSLCSDFTWDFLIPKYIKDNC